MQMTKRIKDGFEILAVKGELDLSNAKIVKTILDKEIDAGQKHLVIDMSELQYIDSSGIGVFINTMQKLRSIGGRFILMSMSESILRIFNMTKLTSFFTIIKKEEDLERVIQEIKGISP